MQISFSDRRHRFGLWGKLILAILAAGTVPIVVGLSVAYFKGHTQLNEVIGGSFEALARDSAAKLDAEILRVIAADRDLAKQAASDIEIRNALMAAAQDNGTGPIAATRLLWPAHKKNDQSRWLLRASWITGPGGTIGDTKVFNDPSNPTGVRISGLRLDKEQHRYIFRISAPILDHQNSVLIGWFHRDYDVKNLLDPLVYPIRFGETGHVMIIDNLGSIVSCPDLVTGSRIADRDLINQVATEKAGWINAQSDGHGGQKFSVIGHAPLSGVNSFLFPGVTWHMFVWQDSSEIFAPARSLLIGIALAGLLAIALLVVLGYYASHRIVGPIRRLRKEAAHIASGDLNRSLDIHTGDEIEDLANQFNEMRLQLRKFIETLEEKVKERTRELWDTQAEKDKVLEQLIQTEKVAAIGTMASGIGHEINNPLYAILGMAEAIRDEKDLAQCNEYGQEIIKYSKHIAEIVRNLSGYIRPASDHDLERVDVNERLTAAVSMARRSLLSDHVQIVEKLNLVSEIRAKPEEIQQVFFNVIRNAIQAIKGKGDLEISSQQNSERILIRFHDTGSGIPKENLGKIFDPFFTTKEPDEGEGLGLYIVQQIIKKYGGEITLESQQGVGTTVTIQFPILKPNEDSLAEE